jgi:hypothetical protein
MALDLGTAIANIGTTWNSALQNKKQRELAEKQQFIENALKQDQLAMQQQQHASSQDKNVFDQQMDLAQSYGGQQMPLQQAQSIFTHPKLQGLAVRPLEQRLPSTSLGGVGVGMQQGQTPMGSQMAAPAIAPSMEKSAGVAPGMAEIQTPMTSGMRIADMQTQAANDRSMQQSELRRSLAEYAAEQRGETDKLRFQHQTELNNARMQTNLAIAGMRNQGRGGSTKLVDDMDETGKPVQRLVDSETGETVKTFGKPPTQARNNMAGSIAEIEAMNATIQEAMTLGKENNWKGTGYYEAPMDEFAPKIPLIGKHVAKLITDKKEETLRQRIAKVMAHGRHDLYGAALTGGERGDANQFLRTIQSNPAQLEIALQGLLEFNNTKLKHLKPAGGMGSGAPVNSANSDQAQTRIRVKVVNGIPVDAATGKPIQ